MSDKRDDKGRFLPGHGGGPGRPSLADEAEYWKALTATATPFRIRKVVEALLRKAERGDVAAANVLLQRLIPVTERRELEHAGGIQSTVGYER